MFSARCVWRGSGCFRLKYFKELVFLIEIKRLKCNNKSHLNYSERLNRWKQKEKEAQLGRTESDGAGALRSEQKPSIFALCLRWLKVTSYMFTEEGVPQHFFSSPLPLLSAPLTANLLSFCCVLQKMTVTDGLLKVSPINCISPMRRCGRKSSSIMALLKNTILYSLPLSAPHFCSLKQPDEVLKSMFLTVVSFWHIWWLNFFATVKSATPCTI